MSERILIIDDENEIRAICAEVLQKSGFQITQSETADDALTQLGGQEHAAVLLDHDMAGTSDWDFLKNLRLHYPDCEVIVMTVSDHYESVIPAIRAGAYDFLAKPFKDVDLIAHVVGKAIEKRSLALRAHELEQLVVPEKQDDKSELLPYQQAKERVVASFTLAYVNKLLKRTGGNIGRAAELAGMERSNFRRLYVRYSKSKFDAESESKPKDASA